LNDLFETNEMMETINLSSMKLMPASEKFIAWWGEIGTKWGVNRTAAEIHALFYLHREPLNAEDIAAALAVSRSNVSASVRELESWGLISPVHFRGDRKQYYEAIKDPWEMFRLILDERKRREIDPTLVTLRACLGEITQSAPGDTYTQERLRVLLEFFEVMIPLYNELRRLPRGPIQILTKLTAKVREVIG
jgi:DNA-binding transcriptional regulator GbsR (MarR family)